MKYTIGTLVTNWDEYDTMKDSFIDKGFNTQDCEYITVDNTEGNTMDAFSGNNWILDNAKGEFVILCHQDIRIRFDTIKTLDNQLSKLGKIDPKWGLAGNAGGLQPGHRALRITDPFGSNQYVGGPFPVRTQSLDGNFIVVKKNTGLRFSDDLKGFHFYDADICIHAFQKGYSIYVLDFHLEHLGRGVMNAVFYENKKVFMEKWKDHLKNNPMQLTTVLISV